MSIYLNNAATSWPKPETVPRAMFDFLTKKGANLARGAAASRDLGTMDMVLSCRESIAELFEGFEDADPRYVTFTSNITESLNIVLKGFLRPGMSVVTTSMEHNAVMRPLRRLEKLGVKVTVVPCDESGFLDPGKLECLLDGDKFDLMVLAHASNVCGVVQDISSIAAICSARDIPLVLDSAQTAGVLPISVRTLDLAALCFTGHKGLMGPQGTGGVVWRPDFAERVSSFIEGGTGSFSHLEFQPESMPDKFEAGTPNLPGIAGLKAAVDWLSEEGVDKIHRRETELGERLLEGLLELKGLILHGSREVSGRLPVFPVNFEGGDNGVIAAQLADLGVETRPGLHCAPGAHRTLGSFPQGALRISVGYFNTEEEIDACLEALKKVVIPEISA